MKYILMIFLIFNINNLFSQQEDKPKEMPKLDIPEITIVGKKAVSLPFARKGEMLIIDYFEAKAADTSILGERIRVPIASGSFAQYNESVQPWRAYLETSAGNYSTLNLFGTASYSDVSWEATIRGGFGTTNGHTKNADASQFLVGGDWSSNIYTDNDLLKSFRAALNTNFRGDKFGIYGFKDYSIERIRRLFDFNTQLTSSEFKPVGFNVGLGLASLSISDDANEASVFSPSVNASATAELASVSLLTRFSYETSSLDYKIPVESPALLNLSTTAQLKFSEKLSAVAGLKYVSGANSDGGSQKFLFPVAILRWDPITNFSVSAWLEPDVSSASYIKHSIENPYLVRQMVLRNEFKPIHIGLSTKYTYGAFTSDATISYSEADDTQFPFVQDGLINLKYADTRQVIFKFTNSMIIQQNVKVFLNGVIQSINERSSNVRLPMIPALQINSRGEMNLNIPMKFWLSADYFSSRKIGNVGSDELPGYFLLNAGASSNIFKSTVLSFAVENIFNSSYDWWYGYEAPGIRLRLKLQYSL